jgi:hypothetical protein
MSKTHFWIFTVTAHIAFWALVPRACERLSEASPLSCESIKDADERHYCRAVTKPDPLECELIKKEELRNACRARAVK